MGKLHILAIPYPAQGHVIPLMELSQRLMTQHGFRVTFVNTEHNHERVMNASLSSAADEEEQEKEGCLEKEAKMGMVSIPDGMEVWEDRNDLGKLTQSIMRVMPEKLEELINKINSDSSSSDQPEEEKISCVIADGSMGWALEVAKKLMIRRVAFWPPAAALMRLAFSIPKLIDDGVVDCDGTPLKKNQMIQLAPGVPAMNPANFAWSNIGDAATQKIVFDVMARHNEWLKLADMTLCNSAYELEPGAFDVSPQVILPIGPLLAHKPSQPSFKYFWQADSTCLQWLDQQQPNSVIYVAFGSFTIFDQTQFKELALGLELTNRPFLWVVRPGSTMDTLSSSSLAYPEGFLERVGDRGRVVGWAPQQEVLRHPSVGCFVSHCGWNSTMEGVGNGVPLLCWPYFADQFMNERYICEMWEVGMRLESDESGVMRKGEIKDKLDRVLGDTMFKANALVLKEACRVSVEEGGHSSNVFKSFVDWLKHI